MYIYDMYRRSVAMRSQTRYESLQRHLGRLSEDRRDFSFNEIESILGRSLPPSASGAHGRQWWANTSTHSQGQAWLNAGWKVNTVDIARRRVEFRRFIQGAGRPSGLSVGGGAQLGVEEPPQPFAGPANEITIRLSELSGSARRMIEDYAEACGGDVERSVRQAIEAAAMERRKQLFDWFDQQNRGLPAGPGSAELIREDRDAR